MKGRVFRFFLIVFLAGCQKQDGFKTAIITSIESSCDESSMECVLDIAQVFDFEWDTLYIVDSMIYPEEISDAIGVNCECDLVTDNEKSVFFIKNGVIVKKYTTELFEITFGNKRKDGIIKIASYSSRFILKKRVFNDINHYYIMK